MKKLTLLLLFILTIIYTKSTYGHELTEDDYWKEEEMGRADAHKVYQTQSEQLKFMRVPGAKCNPYKQHESIIRHHTVRHGFQLVTKWQFHEILNQMCTLMPEPEQRGFYQIMRCYKRRCDCPFSWMTWSTTENRCKIREKYICGQVLILNKITDLNETLGCEKGTQCTEATFSKRSVEDDSFKHISTTENYGETKTKQRNETTDTMNNEKLAHDIELNVLGKMNTVKHAVCKCIPGQICGSPRKSPPKTDKLPDLVNSAWFMSRLKRRLWSILLLFYFYHT